MSKIKRFIRKHQMTSAAVIFVVAAAIVAVLVVNQSALRPDPDAGFITSAPQKSRSETEPQTSPETAAHLLSLDNAIVGLARTEFVYTGSEVRPDEL